MMWKGSVFCQSFQNVIQSEISQAFIYCNLGDYGLQIMKHQNSITEILNIVIKCHIRNSWCHTLISWSTLRHELQMSHSSNQATPEPETPSEPELRNRTGLWLSGGGGAGGGGGGVVYHLLVLVHCAFWSPQSMQHLPGHFRARHVSVCWRDFCKTWLFKLQEIKVWTSSLYVTNLYRSLTFWSYCQKILDFFPIL